MKFKDFLYMDPKGLWALLQEAGKMKVLGPWEDEVPADHTGDWTPIAHRRDPSGQEVAYYGADVGGLIWGVSGTPLDNQPDTVGNRKACDNYLRARGWTLIDLPEAVVVRGWTAQEVGWTRDCDGCHVERFMDSLLVTWPDGRTERRTVGMLQTFAAWSVEFMYESFPEVDINGHHFMPGCWVCMVDGCDATRESAATLDQCPHETPF